MFITKAEAQSLVSEFSIIFVCVTGDDNARFFGYGGTAETFKLVTPIHYALRVTRYTNGNLAFLFSTVMAETWPTILVVSNLHQYFLQRQIHESGLPMDWSLEWSGV